MENDKGGLYKRFDCEFGEKNIKSVSEIFILRWDFKIFSISRPLIN